MIEFVKVPFEQFKKDWRRFGGFEGNYDELSPNSYSDDELYDIWTKIKLPQKATQRSGGYDIFSPFEFVMWGESDGVKRYYTIPTGISFVVSESEGNPILALVPRSGLGFKFQTRLANTFGVIDADYFEAENHGHMMLKMSAEKHCKIEQGKAIAQALIIPVLSVTNEDNSCLPKRTGGFGSTDKKENS